MQWLLRVLHVADPSPLNGDTFLVLPGALLGRGVDASVHIGHASISRHHLRWLASDVSGGVELRNLSQHSAVFIDGSPLAPLTSWRGPSPERIQLGAVLFSVIPVAATEPYADRIEPVASAPALAPLFEVVRDGDACAIRCRGRFVDLPPAACRLFACLAQQSTSVVHRWDLQEAVGPAGNLPQLVTLLRQGIRSLIESEVIGLGELRDAIQISSGAGRSESLDALDPDALLRRLLLSRRSHGYVLCLPPERIRFVEADDV